MEQLCASMFFLDDEGKIRKDQERQGTASCLKFESMHFLGNTVIANDIVNGRLMRFKYKQKKKKSGTRYWQPRKAE